jgi:rhamnulose-1-phosphate aldolase
MNNALFTIASLIGEMGETGRRMTVIDALEASAGNISVFVRQLDPPADPFHDQGIYALPVCVPQLASSWVIISGTGCRLRDISRHPAAAVCIIHIHAGGENATLFAAQGILPTSELNSHLAIHNDHAVGASLHAVLHTHPPYLTYLSHLSDYKETLAFNRRIMRWEPETLIAFPDGIGVLPFEVPGTREMMESTLVGLRRHRAVVWSRHGLVTRAEGSIRKTGDMMEYIETVARCEYLNLLNPNPVTGLSDDELHRVAERFNLHQDFF